MSCHLQHSNSTRLCCASPACCRNVYEAIRRSELWTMRRNDCNGNLKTPHFHTLSHTFRDLERVFLLALSFLPAHRDCRKIRILLRLCPDLCLCRRPKRMTGFVFGFFFFLFFWQPKRRGPGRSQLVMLGPPRLSHYPLWWPTSPVPLHTRSWLVVLLGFYTCCNARV